jgi:hypothetical protein
MKTFPIIAFGIVSLGILIACSRGRDKTGSPPAKKYPDSIEEILAQPDDLDIIFALQERITRKWEDFGFDNLMEPEKVFLRVEAAEREVNNGGFDQYFFNCEDGEIRDADRAFEAIGAKHTAGIVRKASSVFPAGKPPSDRSERQKMLLEFGPKEEAALEKLDEEFYEYQDNIGELLIEYVRRHKDQFK